MIKLQIRLLLALCICLQASAAAVLSSAQLPLEARSGVSSEEEDEPVISTSYVLPNQIFNDGKPYYAGKDPISGQLDFNLKKPASIEAAANEVVDPNEKAIISSSSPNIHDFLNLPVKYSSSKFVYPLVSSSYANLKYQGNNKNFITNKKPTQVIQATSAPNYHTASYFTVPTTKLVPVVPTAPGLFGTSIASSTSTSTSTTRQPDTSSTSTSTSTSSSTSTSTSTSTTSTSTTSTSTSTSTTSTTRAPPSTSSEPASETPKYTTASRVPYIPTTSAAPKTPPTRKKFIPMKKYPFSTTTGATASSPISTTSPPKAVTTSATFSTHHATPPAKIFPTESTPPRNYYPSPEKSTTTGKPIVFTEDPTAPPAFSPIPSSTRIPNLDPADVYHTLDQKNVESKFEQRPTMTLADIFNSLAEEESAVSANSNPLQQGLDAQGNLMEPLDPSKPSPFAMHTAGQRPNLPVAPATSSPVVSAGSQEGFSNEYVSYQVQQPNIMQYRPVPGAINNVVISPGQNSASFVLGSQQQVGANSFGSVEKEPLFSKEHPVQYGTVINEDISTLNRQPPPSPPSPYQEMPIPSSSASFHESGNIGADSVRPDVARPLPGNTFQEPPPPAPSPYQQLPLIGSNLRKPSPPQKPIPPPLPPPQQQQLPSPAAGAGIASIQSVSPQENSDSSVTLGSNQDTRELLVSTNIRFPNNEDHSGEVSSLPVVNGPPAGPQINGHAMPLSLQQIQSANNVVFPKPDEGRPQGNEVKFTQSEGEGSGVQIQKHEVLTMNQHQQKLSLSPLSDPNTPPQHMVPPPRFPSPLPNSINEHELQKPNRPSAGPQYTYNEYTRKPIPGITRPNPDRHLPNILPQFRPNAKLSAGHPQQTNFNQEPGNIRVSGPPPSYQKRGPNPGNPQFSHRRQPLMQQKRYPLNRNIEYPSGGPAHPDMANRRIYRVSPYGGQTMQYLDRPGNYLRRPMPHSLRPAESLNVERHAMAPVLEKLPAFEEEDLVINDPPQPVTPSKEASLVNDAKLEPVVTLQMLQSQKKAVSLPNDDTGDGEIQVPSLDNDEQEPNGAQSAATNANGLYVVYPMKGDKKAENEAEDSERPLPAVAQVEVPTGSDYQNTPFSVVRDEREEPILKNKKPLSLQQQQQQHKAQMAKDSFPYPIEKPDPSFSELNVPHRVPGVVIAPKIINGAHGTGTEAPIAIAYSPTESTYRPKTKQQQMYSNVNLATPVIKEIRQDGQPEEQLNGHDFDLRGQNYEKNFMAPFYPSVSLDTVTSTPTNGWNVLQSTTAKIVYEKNNIDRSDQNDEGNKEAGGDLGTTVKPFELDSFQPELQGGFKPIYPPGYKLEHEQEEQEQLHRHETNNMPLALASRMERPEQPQAASSSSTTSTSTTTTTSTTPKPEDKQDNMETTTAKPSVSTTTTKRVKSKFETSLAALLFGDDEEEQEAEKTPEEMQARKEPTKAMMSGPRSIPRMGPRSLSI